MRRTTTLVTSIFLLVTAGVLSAQGTGKTPEKQPANFKEVQQKAKTFFDQNPALPNEGDGLYTQYKRWEWFNETRLMPDGTFPKPGVTVDNWKKYARSHAHTFASTASTSGTWSFIGPTTTPGGYEGLGRIGCIGFHPTTANTFWIGTPAGGLWKTTDGGATWSTNTDNNPILGVSDIAIDPNTPNTMYIATGDADMGSLSSLTGGYWGDTKSVGVLKSTDGGATWNQTGMNFTVQATKLIRRLLICPTNSNVLIAACSDGIYRTNDAGATWTNTQAGHFIDIAFNPGNPAIFYAAQWDNTGNAQIFTSQDTANTFTQTSAFSGVGRISLGVTPSHPHLVHALCSNASTRAFAGIYASHDDGATFSSLFASGGTNVLSSSFDGSGADGQGEYDLTYLMSPTDSLNIFLGGVNTWKSTDGGVTWNINTMWTANSGQNPNSVITVHADKHFMANDPLTAGTIYQTNDGGIYKSTDGGTTWSDLSNGLAISQVYRIGTSATDATINMTGLQDNGSRKDVAGTWSYATGGDGCECIIDYSNAMNMYGSYVQGKIYATNDAWVSNTTTISANITGTPTGAWITPYVMDPITPTTLYAGYADVYKTADQGLTWTQISTNLTTGSTDYLKDLSVAPSDPNTIYAGTWDSVYVTTNGGTNWTSISGFSLGNPKTYYAINPTNPLNIWVTIGAYAAGEKVYKSTDGGMTWTNVSGTLPNIPVNCIVYEKGSSDGLYIGTDVGVFYTNSTMSDWVPFSSGLPNVVVSELEIQYSSSELRAGTFGRGLWKSDLYGVITGIKPTPSTNSSAIQVFPNPTKGSFTLNIPAFKSEDKANLYNYLGETLKVIDIRSASMQIDLSSYADGIYYIGLESEHYSHMHKIVKLN